MVAEILAFEDAGGDDALVGIARGRSELETTAGNEHRCEVCFASGHGYAWIDDLLNGILSCAGVHPLGVGAVAHDGGGVYEREWRRAFRLRSAGGGRRGGRCRALR